MTASASVDAMRSSGDARLPSSLVADANKRKKENSFVAATATCTLSLVMTGGLGTFTQSIPPGSLLVCSVNGVVGAGQLSITSWVSPAAMTSGGSITVSVPLL